MTNNNNKDLTLARKQINSTEYQILNTKNYFNDISCIIIKITDQQIIEIGQFKNIEAAKEVLGLLDGDDNIGRKVKIKARRNNNVYIGRVQLETLGEDSRIEILGGKEGENEKIHLIFPSRLIESCEFID